MPKHTYIPIATRTAKVGDGADFVQDGESHDVPIGALCGFQISVYVDGSPAEVTSSTWTIAGEQIVVGSVIQTPEEGVATLTSAQVLEGGYDDNPACIATAWIEPGTFSIEITGTFSFEGASYPFNATGQVVVHAPQIALSDLADVTNPSIDNSTIAVSFSTGPLGYECDPIVAGGTIGFIQIVNGIRVRGTYANDIYTVQQVMGSAQGFIDVSADSLFYYFTSAEAAGEIKTEDTPSINCDDESADYTWYQVCKDQSSEAFSTYVAYQAPTTATGIIESYIVVQAVCNWSWRTGATFEDDNWQIMTDITGSNCDPWEGQEWSMPLWTSNSAAVGVWSNV